MQLAQPELHEAVQAPALVSTAVRSVAAESLVVPTSQIPLHVAVRVAELKLSAHQPAAQRVQLSVPEVEVNGRRHSAHRLWQAVQLEASLGGGRVELEGVDPPASMPVPDGQRVHVPMHAML